MSENAVKRLAEKYGDKTTEQMIKDQEDLETQVTMDAVALEQNISTFSKKVDPMTVDGKTLAYIQRPNKSQYERFVPQDLSKYKDKPEEVPEGVARKYEEDIYRLMEELIVSPKHTAQEWKERVGDDFVAAFQAHMFGVRKRATEEASAFLRRTTDLTK